MGSSGVLLAGAPGQLGVELGVVPPPPFICLFNFCLTLLGCSALYPGQQGLCSSPLSCFPLTTLSPELF